MATVWLIAAKDLLQRARDRSLFILGFIAPLALAFVFSVVFGGLDQGGDRIRFDLGLVDLDRGEQAERFIGMLDDVEASGLIDITTYPDPDTGQQAVDDGDVSATIVLPSGLSSAFASSSSVEIQVIGSVDARLATSVATSLARGYATRSATATIAGITAAGAGAVPVDQIAVVANEVGTSTPLVSLAPIETERAASNLTTQLAAGMAVFFVFFVAGTAVTGILDERQAGTLPRLLVSPAPRWSILLGKALAAVIAGSVALVALMATSTLIMNASWGDPLGAVLLAVAAVLAATGIMSMIGGLARTPEQAGNLQAIVAVSMAMLGGSFGMVVPGTDTLWGRLALITPNRWFLSGLDDLAADGVAGAVPAIGVLITMALITGSIAATMANRVLRS